MARMLVQTESPEPPQRASGRVTRSQSRQPSTEPAPQTKQIPKQLSPLSEDSDDQQNESEPDNDDDENESEADDDASGNEAASVVSASGDHQRETFSQAELEDHDPDLMQSSLGMLNSQAKEFLRRFKPRTQSEADLQSVLVEATNEDSRRRKLLDTQWSQLEGTQSNFGFNILNPDRILKGLLRLGTSQALPKPTKYWRPDDVIYKANLASFVHYVVTDSLGSPLTETWEGEFPSPFLTSFSSSSDTGAGKSSLVKETFELALALKTQLVIHNLSAHEYTSQEAVESAIVKTMLYRQEDDMDEAFHLEKPYQGWESLPLEQHYRRGETFARAIDQRTKDIRNLLLDQTQGPASLLQGVARLKERFSWSDFQLAVLRWANLRVDEIDRRIERLGGMDKILDGLEQEIEKRLANPNAAYEDESDEDALPKVTMQLDPVSSNATPAPTGASRKRPARPGTMFRGRPNTPTSTAASGLTSTKQIRLTAVSTAVEDRLDEETLSTSPRTHGDPARLDVKQKRSLLDTQPNAMRVSFDEDGSPSQPAAATRRPRGFYLPGEMPASGVPVDEEQQEDAVVENPSEDGGFESDTRSVPRPHRPRQRSHASPAVKPTEHSQAHVRRRSGTLQDEIDEERVRKRQHGNPGQDIEPLPRSTGYDRVDAVHQATHMAKLRRVQAREEPRARQRWSNEEINCLTRYIGELGGPSGIPYFLIQQVDRAGDDILTLRSQGDMKDKAKLIKRDLLIAGTDEEEWPPNLRYVVLAKKEIDAVRKYVPEYTQDRIRMHDRDLSP